MLMDKIKLVDPDSLKILQIRTCDPKFTEPKKIFLKMQVTVSVPVLKNRNRRRYGMVWTPSMKTHILFAFQYEKKQLSSFVATDLFKAGGGGGGQYNGLAE